MIRRHDPARWRRRRRGAADMRTMEGLATAMAGGDDDAVRALLHQEAALIIDSGGFVPTASGPFEGRSAAARELLVLTPPGTTVAVAAINGVPGLILRRDDSVVGAITAEMRSGRLSTVWVVCNPEKLRHWNR